MESCFHGAYISVNGIQMIPILTSWDPSILIFEDNFSKGSTSL